MSRLALNQSPTETHIMDFFKILDRAGAVLAWIIILVIVWAIGPLLLKILALLGGFQSLFG